MSSRLQPRPVALACAVAAFVAASCVGSTDSGAAPLPDALDGGAVAATGAAEDDPTATPAPETVPPETVPPETVPPEAVPTDTVPPETVPPETVPPTTEAPPPPATEAPLELNLLPGAIGPLVFATSSPDDVVATLTPIVGSPVSVESRAYPEDIDGFYFENFDEEMGFAFPFGRDVCFDNGLCTHFGGATADALTFVGYRQSEGVGALTTPSGVTAGSTGTAFAGVISVGAGGCYSTGGGLADGVDLFLQSAGEPFGYSDDAGAYVLQTPDVDDVTVLSVFAGEEPFFVFDDC